MLTEIKLNIQFSLLDNISIFYLVLLDVLK